MLHATETGRSSDRLGLWLVCAFTLPYVLSGTEILTAFIPRGVFSGGAWNILTNVGRNLSIKS